MVGKQSLYKETRDVFEVLNKIKSSKECYLLVSTNETYYPVEIAVYYIDSIYYFVDAYSSGEVAHVYYTNLNQEK